MALSGRIVASWTPWQTHRDQGDFGHRLRDHRVRSERDLQRALEGLRMLAAIWKGETIFFAVAAPGSVTFRCQTMKADKLGRVRIREWWTFSNGNRLLSSSSVLGVRRQINRRGGGRGRG